MVLSAEGFRRGVHAVFIFETINSISGKKQRSQLLSVENSSVQEIS